MKRLAHALLLPAVFLMSAQNPGCVQDAQGWSAQGASTLADSIPCPNGLQRCNEGPVVNAWSGAAFDTARNCLLVFGGGHGDSWYNGVNRFCLAPQTWEEILPYSVDIPSAPTGDVCDLADSSGKPVSRHTYGGLAYVPQVLPRVADYLFLYGGSPACLAGTLQEDTWLLNLETLTWQMIGNEMPNGPPTGSNGPQVACTYDPTNDLVYCGASKSGFFSLHSFDPDALTWSTLIAGGVVEFPYSHTPPIAGGNIPWSGVVVVNAAGTTLHRHFVFLSANDGELSSVDVDAGSPSLVNRAVTGDTEITDSPLSNGIYEGVGLAFDEVNQVLIAWGGHHTGVDQDDLYAIDPDTLVITRREMPETAGPAYNDASGGVYGRFAYSPSWAAFVALAATSEPVHVWRP
jgi:hypothetical protein